MINPTRNKLEAGGPRTTSWMTPKKETAAMDPSRDEAPVQGLGGGGAWR